MNHVESLHTVAYLANELRKAHEAAVAAAGMCQQLKDENQKLCTELREVRRELASANRQPTEHPTGDRNESSDETERRTVNDHRPAGNDDGGRDEGPFQIDV